MIDVGVTAPDFVAPAVADGNGTEIALYRLVESHRAVAVPIFGSNQQLFS